MWLTLTSLLGSIADPKFFGNKALIVVVVFYVVGSLCSFDLSN